MRFLMLATLFIAMILACKSTTKTKNDTKTETPQAINLCGPTKADLNTEPGKSGHLSPLYEGLDVYHYKITTKSDLAQKYFDQGLLLNYGFNHAEASRSFREAIRLDPECAMCYWGLAFVLGPNYNASMEDNMLAPANEALNKARMFSYLASSKEQALIKALSKRYPQKTGIDPAPNYEAYAETMKQVQATFPADVDIAVLTAEALMNLHPWDIWQKSKEPHPWTAEIIQLLEHALKLMPDHPHGLHMYIHAMEASPNPEKATPAADRLRFRVPGAGHLMHMPSHLYINTGNYHEGTLANERAVKVDSSYVEACHEEGIYPLMYYPHNWHFLAACAALEGKGIRALEASNYMKAFVVDQKLMYNPEMATLQHFYSIPWYIMVKFAMWDKILKEPQPDPALTYPNIVWNYARGMAYAANGKLEEAASALESIIELEKETTLEKLSVFGINNFADLSYIAEQVLTGEIARQKADYHLAISHLKKAIEVEDQLNYNEPPDWFFSVRHLLGDVYLKAGVYEAAEKTYREDLETLKENGWALKGLYKSLIKQKKTREANAVLNRFQKAWQWAEVELNTSVIES